MALLKIGALWKAVAKDGKKKYLSGVIDYPRSMRILIFVNDYKKDEKHPDYVIYADEQEPEEKPNELPF